MLRPPTFLTCKESLRVCFYPSTSSFRLAHWLRGKFVAKVSTRSRREDWIREEHGQVVAAAGECVWYQPLKESGSRKKKFDAKFCDGVYLGIQENSLLKWIGISEGVVRAWSIKLRPESEKRNVDEFNGFVGLSWQVRPSSSRDGMKILPGIEKDLVLEIQDNVDQPKKDVVVEVKRKGYVP